MATGLFMSDSPVTLSALAGRLVTSQLWPEESVPCAHVARPAFLCRSAACRMLLVFAFSIAPPSRSLCMCKSLQKSPGFPNCKHVKVPLPKVSRKIGHGTANGASPYCRFTDRLYFPREPAVDF